MAPAERKAQKEQEEVSRQHRDQDMAMLKIRIPYREMHIVCQPYTCPILFLDLEFIHVPNGRLKSATMKPAQISLANLRGEIIYNAFVFWTKDQISYPQMKAVYGKRLNLYGHMNLDRVMEDFSVSSFQPS